MRYAIEIEPDDNGTLIVTCPDIPEVVTFADTREEAGMRAADAIETALAGYIAERRPIPPPLAGAGAWAAIPSLSVIKIELYRAMQDEGIGKAELARRLGVHLPQLDRLLDLKHRSRLEALERALAAVGRTVEIQVYQPA